MSKLPVPTAKEINDAHAYAKECAETAVEHAIKCGAMLARKKEQLGHGGFGEWVRTYCDFSDRQARRYMEAATKTDTRVRFESVRQLLDHDKPKPEPKPAAKPVSPPPDAATSTATPSNEGAVPASAGGEPERPVWDADEDAALERAQQELAASTERVMSADDKLAAAYAEIKRQASEIATLKVSRDGYMNGKAAVTELLKKEQRKVARLEKELKQIRASSGIAA